QMPPPAKPPCINDAKPIPRRPAALAAKNAARSALVRKPSDTSTPSPRRIGTSWSSPSRIRDMPGRMPPRANPDGNDTDGNVETPSFFATLLKLPINALLITVSTTNRIGSFALSLMPSHALPTVSFNVSKALPTFSVAVSNNGFTVSRNQVATGLMTLFLMKAQASRNESRKQLNPVFTESITLDSTGHAVSRNHVTTGLITLFMTNAHAAWSESRMTSKPVLIASMTLRITGQAVSRNQDTTAEIAALIPSQAGFSAFFHSKLADAVTESHAFMSNVPAVSLSQAKTSPDAPL